MTFDQDAAFPASPSAEGTPTPDGSPQPTTRTTGAGSMTMTTPQKTKDLLALGERVREVRQQQGFTQVILARELGISVAYLSLIERGGRNPPYTTVVDIARALHVAPKDLVTA